MSGKSKVGRPIPAADYERIEREGWNVLVSPELGREKPRARQEMIDVLSNSLRVIRTTIPTRALLHLLTVPIWLEYGNEKRPAGEYHHNAEWLSEHMIVEKLKGVQFSYKLVLWINDQPSLVIHELAHAYHYQVLTLGYEPINRAYKRARKSGIYESVERFNTNGTFQRSYALTNPLEFFAELSESYFGTGDYYPFTRAQFEAFDPESAKVISEAWHRGDP
jgi:Glucose-regulated metallo-peptidase M90